MENILCFALGLSREDIDKGKALFNGVNGGSQALEVIAVTKTMLASTVLDVMTGLITDSGPDSAYRSPNPQDAILPEHFPYRVVIVNAMERDQVMQIMRSFKAALPDPQNLILAVITETALNWTFDEYIGHLTQEHETLKTRKTQN